MQQAIIISTVANAIQLSVAPVFLLTGIGAILAVMANRLSRVVDRHRALGESGDRNQAATDKEMETLMYRARWVHWAISLSTVSALLICIVIAALFIGSEMSMEPSRVVSSLFITAMLTLIFGLLCFLREIYLSTGTIEKVKK